MVFVMAFLFQWKNLGISVVNKNNENLTSLLHLVISCMSARSAPQILPQLEEYTFLVMVLCNSSANCWSSEIIAIHLCPAFLSKIFQTIDANPHWYPSYFALLENANVLSCNTLSEAVLLSWNLHMPYRGESRPCLIHSCRYTKILLFLWIFVSLFCFS